MDRGKCCLRRAGWGDLDLLYLWANDPVLRKNAFHCEPIAYEDHVRWFREVMENSNIAQMVMLVGKKPVGQIRFNMAGQEAEIGYSIASEYRGFGYGKKLLKLGIQYAKDELKIEKLVAKVKKDNIISAKCFLGNKFREAYIQYEYELDGDFPDSEI